MLVAIKKQNKGEIIEEKNEISLINTVENKEIEIEKDWSEIYTKTVMDNYVDINDDTATIPEGFQVSLKQGENKIIDGLVVRDAETKNEFVWIPCDKTDLEFESDVITKSVQAFGGFYISRYEAGVENGELSTTDGWNEESMLAYEPSWTGWIGVDIELVSKKDAYIWNYLTINKAEELSTNMYKNNKDISSDLITTKMWDKVIEFIGDNDSIDWGNYGNSSFEIDSQNAKMSLDGGLTYNEIQQNKIAGNKYLYTTGASTQNKRKQIYDIAGNVWEFNKPIITVVEEEKAQETNNNQINNVINDENSNETNDVINNENTQPVTEIKYVCRGGAYTDDNNTVSNTGEINQNFANMDLGFRVILYIK